MVELCTHFFCLSKNLVPSGILAGHMSQSVMGEEFEIALEVAIDKVLFREVVDESDKDLADLDGGLLNSGEKVGVLGERGSGERGIFETHDGVAGFGERGEVALGAVKGWLGVGGVERREVGM